MPSQRLPISTATTLAAADDVNGDPTNAATYLTATGASRVLIIQHNNGTLGTVGIDAIEVSKDGGQAWALDGTLKKADGTAAAGSLLNAAGVEPVNYAAFFGGPYDGPTLLRCVRDAAVSATSVAWTTGAPSVVAFKIG